MSGRAGLLGVAFFSFFAVGACTGGGDPGTSNSGGTSSSSGSSASSSGSSASSSSGGTNPALTCTEIHVGGTNDPLGGSATSRVIAQGVIDYGSAATEQVSEVTTSCKNIASALGAPAGDQATADAQPTPREKAKAWCKLATNALGASKAKSGGTLRVRFEPSSCKTSVHTKATCQGSCTDGPPCDTNANPMTCTGGTLANGFCEGGKLEGGCDVEARCDVGCDASTVAAADCAPPAITVESEGAADPAEAAKLKASLEADLPRVIALKNKCLAEVELVSSLTATISTATDIKAACIPTVVAAAGNAAQDVKICAEATASMLAVAGG